MVNRIISGEEQPHLDTQRLPSCGDEYNMGHNVNWRKFSKVAVTVNSVCGDVVRFQRPPVIWIMLNGLAGTKQRRHGAVACCSKGKDRCNLYIGILSQPNEPVSAGIGCT